jgi:photosystem II stability/assembly factor-like uncharacterized protein
MYSTFRWVTCIFLFLISGISALNAQWQQVLTENGVISNIRVFGNYIYAASDVDGASVSDDFGNTWTPINNGLDMRVHDFAVIDNMLFAGTLGGVFRSTDNGANWTEVNNGLTNLNVYPLAVIGSNLFAGTTPGGVFLSTDYGDNWTEVNSGLTNTVINAFAVIGTNLFAATNGKVFLSTDNGTSWTNVSTGLSGTQANCFAVNGTDLFVGMFSYGVFLTTDNGASWTSMNNGLTDPTMLALLNVDGTNLLAGTYGSGVYHSSDYGASWTQINDGITNLNISSLSGTGMLTSPQGFNYLFAGNIGDPTASVWRRDVSQITSVREQVKNEIPENYALQQNYPNPFNPSTRIVYSVPQQSVVTIKVFDILGDEIATLVNENKETGTYELTWNAENLTGGVYFYQIKANSFIQTKKMVLLK